VWLKSGGSIVINSTEASSPSTSTPQFLRQDRSLEDTSVKTNLDAIPEIVRQIRLRDLASSIIICFSTWTAQNRNRLHGRSVRRVEDDPLHRRFFSSRFWSRRHHPQRVKQYSSAPSRPHATLHRPAMVKSPVPVCRLYIEMRKMRSSRPRRRHARRHPRSSNSSVPLTSGFGDEEMVVNHPRQSDPQPPPRAVRHHKKFGLYRMR